MAPSLVHFLLVAVGGGIGAALRHAVGMASLRLVGIGFPWGTLTVNVAGSFMMGLLVAVLARGAGHESAPALRLFLATGVLGGFTTFSAFSLEAVLLWERGEALIAAIYVVGSVMAGVAALFAGLAIVRALAA